MRPQLRFRDRDDKCIAWTRLGMLFGKDEKKKPSREWLRSLTAVRE